MQYDEEELQSTSNQGKGFAKRRHTHMKVDEVVTKTQKNPHSTL